MSTIIVGVDGSDASERALHWALEEARLRGAVLEVVHAWPHPHAPLPGYRPSLAPESVRAMREAAKELVEDIVAGLPAELSGIDVRAFEVEGPPAQALLDAAQGADLLVVGSRGRGGFAGLLLGSVSQQCAHHARCPVVIVPPAR